MKNSSANVILLKIKLSKMIQSRGFLSRHFGPLMKVGLQLMKNVINSLAKSVIILLRLAAAE